MSNKLAFFDGMSPEQKGALIGSLLGAGVGGIGGAVGSKKNKLRNSILAALAGGAGGAGLGYLGGRYFGQPSIADITKKTAPEAAKALNDPAGYAFRQAIPAAAKGLKAIDAAKSKISPDFLRQLQIMNSQGQPALEESPFKAVTEPVLDQGVPGFEIPPGMPQGGGEPGLKNQSDLLPAR